MEYTGTENYVKGILYDHHPIFDTFFMGIIITGIKNFTGHWDLALFGYVLIQGIFSAIAFAYTIEYTYNKLNLDARIGIVMILIYSLLPIFPMSVQTISKDALFSWTEYSPIVSMDWHNQLNAQLIPEKVTARPAISEYTTNSYQNIIDELYQIPLIKLFFTYGLYASIIPGFIFATVFRKFRNRDIKYWIATVPMFLSIALGCWLAPVSIAAEGKRYLYPVIYTIPLMLAWCIYIYKRENTFIKKVEDKING